MIHCAILTKYINYANIRLWKHCFLPFPIVKGDVMSFICAIPAIFIALSIVLSKPHDRLESVMCSSTIFAVLYGGAGFILKQIGAIAEYYSPLYSVAIVCAVIAFSVALMDKLTSTRRKPSHH